jgi:metallophosphoesterase (TIGR00282 family)
MSNIIKILFVGDVVGQPGLVMFQKWMPKLREQYAINAILVNGENAAKNGRGLSGKALDFFKHNGAAVVTSGNHIWENREFHNVIKQRDDIIRPANYPAGCPGKGYAFFEVCGYTAAIINLHGRVFVRDLLDCPFRVAESLLTFLKSKTSIIVVDFHAEATAEKRAMGFFLDGKVSVIVGTHTHVPTADAQILPHGTGYMTDVGYVGAANSVIGMQVEGVLNKFLYAQHLGKFIVDKRGPIELNGVYFELDVETGKTVKIEHIRVVDYDISKTLGNEDRE